MSTCAQIKLKEEGATASDVSCIYVYRHHDGYPEGEHGVLALLYPLVKDFIKVRGWDDSYLLMRIAQAVANHTGKKYTGCGLDCVEHGDIAYLYEIDSKGTWYINGKAQSEEKILALISKP